MKYLKFIIFATFLFFGILAQRFQRHIIITNDTDNGILIDGLNFPGIPDELAADRNYIELNKYGEITIELLNGKLEFEICSDGCMDKEVVVCYGATNIVSSLQSGCGPNQCRFNAGILKESTEKFLWFMSHLLAKTFTTNICETAVLKSPKIIPSFVTSSSYDSCEPLTRDGNMVKLFVKEFGCSLKVVKECKNLGSNNPISDNTL
uniref:Uncharacterized protein n=1 Tax=Panagrolaimus superbus TaxID=310955 RepID=A0A914ZC35_9BILA